ncbi:MAG: YceI family protein [Flammeovirgaceae bacterium]
MKKISFIALLLVGVVASAFATGNAKPNKYVVDASKSAVKWVGEKVTGKHEGGISVKSGALEVKNGQLKGGEFLIDMTSITCTDLQGEWAGKLVGHLHSDDFFSTEKFPISTLKITKAKAKGDNNYEVTADLTIKGITKPVTFTTSFEEAGNAVNAKATIKVNRTEYDIKYGSASFFDNLADKAISDEFTITVDLTANPS